MAGNILEGGIRLTDEGVSRTAAQVTNAVSNVEKAFKKLTPASGAATQSLINISRVAQDAPFGFIGIANNINPLVESFQRLKVETGSTSGALSSLKGALTGPAGVGLAVGIVSSLLVSFGDRLFNTVSSFSDAELSAARFSAELRRVKDNVDNLKTSLDFQGKLEKIGLELSGATGANLSAGGRGVDIKNNTRLIAGLTGEINKLSAAQQELVRTRLEAEKFGAGIGGQSALGKALLGTGGNIDAVLQLDLSKFSKADQELLKRYKATNDQLKDLKGQRDEAFRGIALDAATLPLDFTRENRGVRVPSITVKPEKILIEPNISRNNLLTAPVRDLSFNTGNTPLQRSSFLDDFRKQNEAQLEPIRERLLELAKLGQFVGESIAGAFTNAFSAIAAGESPIRAIGEAVKSLVVDLIQAALRALVVKAIVSLFAPGAGSALSLGGISGILEGFGGFRAAGGGVEAGKTYAVGERGMELFRPNVSGSIVPNNQLSNYSGSSGMGGVVEFRIAGNTLKGVLSNVNASQLRLVGR